MKFRPRVIPVLLLRHTGLVKTVKFDKSRYIGDPINAVRIFNDLEADELVFLDITASKEGRTIDPELVRQIGDEAYMPFAVGGGIGSVRDAISLVGCGAEKVILNTSFFRTPDLVTEIAKALGNQSVLVSIDVRRNLFGHYKIYTRSGYEKVPMDPVEAAKRAESLGAGEILINSIDRDGMMTGYDLELIRSITEAVEIPVIACGGAGKPEHLKEAVNHGAHAVAAGSIFVYHGPRNAVLVNYPDKKELINTFI